MGHWLDKWLKALGVTTVLGDLGQQMLQGQRLDLPPAILGKLGDDPKKESEGPCSSMDTMTYSP